jgi:hypothetical protein
MFDNIDDFSINTTNCITDNNTINNTINNTDNNNNMFDITDTFYIDPDLVWACTHQDCDLVRACNVNYQFVTNISVKKYKKVPEQFIGEILKKSVERFPIVYKKHDVVEKLLEILKIERKHPESKLYYQVIGSFVGTRNIDITYGNDFLNVISEYYNTNLYNIPENSYPISFYNINLNCDYFFYVYRFTYYNTYNEIVQININEYYFM